MTVFDNLSRYPMPCYDITWRVTGYLTSPYTEVVIAEGEGRLAHIHMTDHRLWLSNTYIISSF